MHDSVSMCMYECVFLLFALRDLSIMPLPPSSKGFALSGVTRKAANHGSDSNIASQSYAPNTVSFVTPISYPATLTVEVALGHT